MNGVLAICEQTAGVWNRMSFETLAAAQQLGRAQGWSVSAAILGQGAAALAAAATARWPRLKTLALLALPILAAAGLKLLVEDLRAGSPATLFAAFVFYGATLLLVPRLLRAGSRRSP